MTNFVICTFHQLLRQ